MTDERVIEILQEIKDKIDTSNRGTCDYFIVDQIEEIVKRELSNLKGENKLTCDRNICLQNEYNNIGCEDCVVTKGENE